MNILSEPEFTIDLPPINTFHRPFWAYDLLPDGWNILRRLLFGDTRPLLEELTALGNQRLTTVELNRLLRPHHIHPTVHCTLMQASRGKSASELAAWYEEWEDRHFEAYCQQVHQQERAKIGLKQLNRAFSYKR